MLPYWLIFLLWTLGALQTHRNSASQSNFLLFTFASIVTTLMIGFRFEVGGDWGAYERMYEDIYFLSLRVALGRTDPAYALLNWVAAQFDMGVIFVNLVCAVLFMGGLARLAWRQPNPMLAVLVALPYLIIVVAMGYTRQAAAIGIICFALATASERHLIRLTLMIGLAALFHKTAILVLPIALVPIFRRNLLFGGLGAILFGVLFFVLLRDSSDRLVTNYVQSNYDSQGALIRVGMNVVAGVLFLLLRKRIAMPYFQKSFWMSCSVLAFISVIALNISSASSGIDRISLYLIPLQSVVYSRLPFVLNGKKAALPSIVIGVIAYSFLVQFVWLNYAENAVYWIPYSLAGSPA